MPPRGNANSIYYLASHLPERPLWFVVIHATRPTTVSRIACWLTKALKVSDWIASPFMAPDPAGGVLRRLQQR